MATYAGADGTELHYEQSDAHRADQAPVVIALAGGAARHPSYLGDLAGLPVRLVVPHLRGVGNSPLGADTEGASYWRQADDIENLRGRLGLAKLNLLAHSAGSRLAIAYALQYPKAVGSLMLVTPPAASILGMPSDADELIARRAGDPEFDDAVRAWNDRPADYTDTGLTAWYAKAAPMSYAQWNDTAKQHTAEARYAFAANRAWFSVAPPEDLVQRLASVTAPVLVMGGAEDCGTGRAPVAALAEHFPDARHAEVEGCGHYPWVEHPQRFREIAERFYEQCASS